MRRIQHLSEQQPGPAAEAADPVMNGFGEGGVILNAVPSHLFRRYRERRSHQDFERKGVQLALHGIAYYYRADTQSDWYVYAGTAKPGMPFAVSKVSNAPIASHVFGSAFGDFFQVAFGPDSKLNVVWTALNKDLQFEGLNSDVYFARQK